MGQSPIIKAGIFGFCSTAIFLLGWEIYLRSNGFNDLSYDDGTFLWADKIARIDPDRPQTVFIGSSRIKYDLDIPSWNALTGEEAIQLAIEGSSPLPVLEYLGNHETFNGKLIIDVTEGLFFSTAEHRMEKPKANVQFFEDQTPAQRFSFKVNTALESNFVFLDKDHMSLNAMIDHVPLPSRPGAFQGPVFPFEFERVSFGRQAYMTKTFIADTQLQNRVIAIWDGLASRNKMPPMADTALTHFVQRIKTSVDRIRERGGIVVFVRTPSSGSVWQREQKFYPREQYWTRLLDETCSPGIYFMDYPVMARMKCPENSHLSPADAILFTEQLVQILQKEMSWTFHSHSSQ
jgi:hypothetical protein